MLATVIILALFGIIMLCLEVVLPGAIVGIVGAILIVVSVILTFITPEMQAYGAGFQIALSIGIVISTVAIFLWWMRYFHTTFIGRHLILHKTSGDSSPASVQPDIAGKTGIAKSDLRPSGTVVIDGTRYEAKCPAGFLPQGTAIKVSKWDGDSLLVFALPEEATN